MMRKANLTDGHNSTLDISSFTPVFHGWQDEKLQACCAEAAKYSADVKVALLETLKD